VSSVRRLVYVSGSPGAGKTSLAGPLAAELGYALLTKDLIKETLHDALGAPEPDLAARPPPGATAPASADSDLPRSRGPRDRGRAAANLNPR
jgi:predicted kinase